MGGNGGDASEGLEKTLDLRMQELILSTRVPPGEASSFSGEVRNTSDRRTDPNMSCICICARACVCVCMSKGGEERDILRRQKQRKAGQGGKRGRGSHFSKIGTY